MENPNKLLKEVLEDLKPDEKKVAAEVNITLKKLNSALKKAKIRAKASTGGSIAKGTFLKGDYDCDIFVKFELKKYKEKDISALLGNVLKKSFKKVTKVHGSRDYYHIENEFRYEIVPVLDIKKTSEAVNVTDCSPLHVDWVNKFPRMKSEIRLTKAFMKAVNTYGAESYIKGFSGHVVDILTIYYGGFINLLKASQKWKEKDVVDYYNRHKGKALLNLNKSKTESALIVIDPIQNDRNAAAALSIDKFSLFKRKAAEFIKKPSKRFFIREKFDADSLRKKAGQRGGKLVIVDAAPLKGKEDVIGAKLLKAFEHIAYSLKENEFDVKEKGWDWPGEGDAVFWFIIDTKDLPDKKLYTGPPIKVKKHCENFKKVHKGAFEKNGKVYAEERREYTNAERFISGIIQTDHIKEKVSRISLR